MVEGIKEKHKTYQTCASLCVTTAGMAITITPLTCAQVQARARPSVTIITLLQQTHKLFFDLETISLQ